MSKQASKTLIGGFVVGAVALVIAGVLMFGSGRFLKETAKFVLFFEGSMKGLDVGASVLFKGVKVGSVTGIKVCINPDDLSIRTPVFIEIEPDLVSQIGGVTPLAIALEGVDLQKIVDTLVQRGLRAKLQLQSLVTGKLLVAFDFHPGTPVYLVGLEKKYPELPTIPSTLEELSKRVGEIPIEEIFQKLLSAVEGIEGIVNSPAVIGTVRSLNQAVKDAGKLMRHVDAEVGPLTSSIEDVASRIEDAARDARKLVRHINGQVAPLASSIKETVEDYGKLARNVDGQIAPLVSSTEEALEELRAALENGRKTLAVVEDNLAEDSPLLYELNNTLKEVGAAARSIRLLADYLKRHPEALLKGKSRSGGK